MIAGGENCSFGDWDEQKYRNAQRTAFDSHKKSEVGAKLGSLRRRTTTDDGVEVIEGESGEEVTMEEFNTRHKQHN